MRSNFNRKFYEFSSVGIDIMESHLRAYSTPKDLTHKFSFGFVSGVALMVQIVSGLFLSIYYIPTEAEAWLSINDFIQNDVRYGWLFRYIHMNNASVFFILVYLHIIKAMYTQAYSKKGVWFSGLFILLSMMAEAFTGYVLPWGQMSYWGATVITNFFTALPFIGTQFTQWIWGGFSLTGSSIGRFYSVHFYLPLLILGLVAIHLYLVHLEGSTTSGNSTGNVGKIDFYPFFIEKDINVLFIYLIALSYFVFFRPNYFNHPENYIPANPLVTPKHIVPEWYFLPLYAMLRSVADKTLGIIIFVFAIVVLFIIPFFVKSTTRSNEFKALNNLIFPSFVLCLLLLGWLGARPAIQPYTDLSLIFTVYYFFYILFIIPVTEQYNFVVIQRGHKEIKGIK